MVILPCEFLLLMPYETGLAAPQQRVSFQTSQAENERREVPRARMLESCVVSFLQSSKYRFQSVIINEIVGGHGGSIATYWWTARKTSNVQVNVEGYWVNTLFLKTSQAQAL